MVVRELVAMLGVRTDAASFSRANSSMSKLTGFARTLIPALGGIGAAFAVKSMVQKANEANKVLGRLKLAFGENADGVAKWAEDIGEATARCEVDIQKMAAGLGITLTPMLEGNKEAAAAMSKQMTELALDLGTLGKGSPEDALQALQAGLLGATRPMRRFGILMDDAAIEEWSKSKGMKANLKGMTQQQKMQLKMNYLLDKTSFAQGRAKKSAKGYDGQMRSLENAFEDASIKIGKQLIPAILALVPAIKSVINVVGPWINIAAKLIGKLAELTKVIVKFVDSLPKEAKILLAAAAVLVFRRNILKLFNTPMGKWALLLTALAIAFDDYQAYKEGRPSLIAHTKDFWTAENDNMRYAGKMIQLYFEDMGNTIWLFLKSIYFSLVDVFEGFITIIGSPFDVFGSIIQFFKDIVEVGFVKALSNMKQATQDWAKNVWNLITSPFRNIGGWIGETVRAIAASVGITLGIGNKQLPPPPKGSGRQIAPSQDPYSGLGQADPTLRKSLTGPRMRPDQIAYRLAENANRMNNYYAGGKKQSASAIGSGGARPSVFNNQTSVNVTINAPGNQDPKGLASHVEKQVNKVLDQRNRKTLNTLVPQPVGG
jgi:hypothetical protein